MTRILGSVLGRCAAAALLACAVLPRPARAAFTLHVVDGAGAPVHGWRFLVEADTTNRTVPGAKVSDSISVDIHKSYAPVVYKGNSFSASTVVNVPANSSYVVSVLPLSGHSLSGTTVEAGQTSATVTVRPHPILTSQITVFVFEDNYSINNAPDIGAESGLAGFGIVISDFGGQVMVDAFGNPLGTTYEKDGSGNFILDPDGNPVVEAMGTGVIVSGPDGMAQIKYLAPGKYGVIVVPPAGEGWIQTATIEGTPTIDAWVKANEPPVFVEGFGVGFTHVATGFVKPSGLPGLPPGGTGTITGTLVNNHFSRPPRLQGFFPGEPVSGGWVGLNDPATGQGLIAVPCDPDAGTFSIPNVPPGSYQLVTWDEPLDMLFGFNIVTVPPGGGGTGDPVPLGNVLCFRWFGTLKGSVFYDANQNGFRDPGEVGIPDQAVNLRFRDGSIYQFTASTPPDGEYSFDEVFPFFKWLVVEVDFLRYKATGMTAVVDYGGEVLPDNGWVWPSRGMLHPQPQAQVNPNTGNNRSRTETGEVLTQAMMLFLGQTNFIDWGKVNYPAGENGGVSGIVYYATTRAEDDPRLGVGEEWEPGIPRVQVNLYMDADGDGVIDDLDGDGRVTPADVDNHPFGWAEGGPKGPEDIDHNGNGVFDAGDAIQIASTDSWDDSMPVGSVYEQIPVVHGKAVMNGFDGFGTWNQVRPGVFDGGYAFGDLENGTYIVEAVPPPGYRLVKEEDRNVDFGEAWTPGILALPVACVGEPHTVPDQFSLFPGEAPYAGETRPLCNRKQVEVSSGLNAAADFFFFTEVPKAARMVGFVNNDLAAEFDTSSPIYGEKAAPAWIPISIKDWAGTEVARVYCDQWGGYNALIPSTYSVNVPSPSGVSPNMITVVLNDPFLPGGGIDPFYDPNYSVTPWTFDFWPGRTTYLDTPIVPIAGFVTNPTGNVDAEPPDGTPVILSVVNAAEGGPLVCAAGGAEIVTITSMGAEVPVPNPAHDPSDPLSPMFVNRDYGFGGAAGSVTVDGLPLAVQSWNATTITATVPLGVTTGQLMVTRDSGVPTETGVTLHVGGCGPSVIRVPADRPTIQAAIDAAAKDDLILVAPGTYDENPILYKKVRLQGSGPATAIFANPNPSEALQEWHDRLLQILADAGLPDTYEANDIAKEAPGIMVLGNIPGFEFDAAPPAGLIDGFHIFGSLSGGGIYVNNDAAGLVVSNNRIRGNQGNHAGGITVGTPDLGFPSPNDAVAIRFNRIAKNGGVRGAGGIGIYAGADDYLVEDNIIAANFSRYSGGGIAHVGLSDGGRILRNRILFNEVFYGLLLAGAGDGGGIHVAGETVPGALSDGAGSVTIDRNLIQGNLAGAGNGGGISAVAVNGADLASPPADWYALNVFNTMIVNNAAGLAGGGVSLQDCARVNIVNSTIAHNDSTATSANAFGPGDTLHSIPQGAGIVSHAHSALFAAASGQTHADPVLRDSILWRNRSFSWDATMNDNAGGLVPDPATPAYNDLFVKGFETPPLLGPLNCILTDAAGYDGSNSQADPLFAAGYVNTLYSSAVLDEGGNAISVRFTPLTEGAGDYHIQAGSGARDIGGVVHPSAAWPETDADYDGEVRPNPDTLLPDAGADEYY
ncbi:MAG: SdrD B-like domain-containing protein [bacterium]|nr:SdrD B-like domain-containing protein [bacterium]